MEGLLNPSAFCYRLEILAAPLPWISANDRLFWRVRAARTKGWREAACKVASAARLPRLRKGWVVCELRFSNARRRDPANWSPTAKACVDGLVDAGVFPDDDHKHVIGPDMRIGPKVPAEQAGLHLLIYPMEIM